MKVETYLRSVLKEINNIKKHATPEEIDKLNFNTLDAGRPSTCIYGQMTGNCFSYRASELINKCSFKYSIESLMDSFERGLNEQPTRDGKTDRFSLLEHIICSFPKNNQNIIAYLKGELKVLKLKVK